MLTINTATNVGICNTSGIELVIYWFSRVNDDIELKYGTFATNGYQKIPEEIVYYTSAGGLSILPMYVKNAPGEGANGKYPLQHFSVNSNNPNYSFDDIISGNINISLGPTMLKSDGYENVFNVTSGSSHMKFNSIAPSVTMASVGIYPDPALNILNGVGLYDDVQNHISDIDTSIVQLHMDTSDIDVVENVENYPRIRHLYEEYAILSLSLGLIPGKGNIIEELNGLLTNGYYITPKDRAKIHDFMLKLMDKIMNWMKYSKGTNLPEYLSEIFMYTLTVVVSIIQRYVQDKFPDWKSVLNGRWQAFLNSLENVVTGSAAEVLSAGYVKGISGCGCVPGEKKYLGPSKNPFVSPFRKLYTDYIVINNRQDSQDQTYQTWDVVMLFIIIISVILTGVLIACIYSREKDITSRF